MTSNAAVLATVRRAADIARAVGDSIVGVAHLLVAALDSHDAAIRGPIEALGLSRAQRMADLLAVAAGDAGVREVVLPAGVAPIADATTAGEFVTALLVAAADDALAGSAAAPPPPVSDRPALAREVELAPSPTGADPFDLTPWASRVLRDPVTGQWKKRADGSLVQYFVDVTGFPVLTANGGMVHVHPDRPALVEVGAS